MKDKFLICSDLDRTIIPNGPQDESPIARPLLRKITSLPPIVLVYVTGRHKKIIIDAIKKYELPIPRYIIADVGTTIYETVFESDGMEFIEWKDWQNEIAADWKGMSRDAISDMLRNISELKLQEPEKQNTYKISYYVRTAIDPKQLVERVKHRLTEKKINTGIIWSVDEKNNIGLLDILPEQATKFHAIRFLMQKLKFTEKRTVFSGDSGNDLPVLTSGLQSTLVKNASEIVRNEAVKRVTSKGIRDKLYLASGNFLGLNGNYAAGVIEGVYHFLPESRQWIENAVEQL